MSTSHRALTNALTNRAVANQHDVATRRIRGVTGSTGCTTSNGSGRRPKSFSSSKQTQPLMPVQALEGVSSYSEKTAVVYALETGAGGRIRTLRPLLTMQLLCH